MGSSVAILSLLLAVVRSGLGFVPENGPINPRRIITTSPSTSLTPLTQRFQSANADEISGAAEEDGESSGWSDADLYASLRTRLSEVEDRSTKMPLVVLDSMLPRQVLTLKISNPLLMQLVRSRLASENPHFGVMGMARLSNGQQIHLKRGVEVRIDEPEFTDDEIQVNLVAGRRFEIDDATVEHVEGGWTEARVTFLNSAEEEDKEIQKSQTTQERMAVARAISKAEQFDSPSATLEDNQSLVDRWVELARENEREPGQIDKLLDCIGDMPPSDQPTERAMWIGALINPLPALGVSLEIRPSLLTSNSAERRVDIALDGILRSIRHMDGTSRIF